MARARVTGGFTLVELIAVMGVVALLAVSSIPAISSLGSAKSAHAKSEISDRFIAARAYAAASGSPAGVAYDSVKGSLTALRFVEGAAVALIDEVGADLEPLVPSQLFGVSIASFDPGVDAAGIDAIWFDATGAATAGDVSGPTTAMTRDAEAELSGGDTVTVRRVSGAID